MSDFRDLFDEHEDQAPLWYGVVSKDINDLADEVTVTIPDFDPKLEWGPCKWQARDADTLPQKNDKCLIAFDNRREPWVIAWWPF